MAHSFLFDAKRFNLPTREELVELRIWDSHFHGFMTTPQPIKQHHETMYYIDRMGIERVISLDVGGTLANPLGDSGFEAEMRTLLETDRERVSGIIPIEPSFPEQSCEKMERWIRHGPCIGIKYVGGNKNGVRCSDPSNDPIIKLAGELGAVVYIHSWLKVGGTPRQVGGGNYRGESSPLDVAILARRFPRQTFICGHSGGDWELAVRAVRSTANVMLEFTGSDPHSGSVEYAVRELGVERIVWGGHGPTRSLATELSKVFDTDISWQDKAKVFGGNYRRLAAPILERKGVRVVV